MYLSLSETRVLVGTGMNDRVYGYTEIYHVQNQSATVGPLMPFGPLHGASSTPFGDSFVIAGGSKPALGGEESTGKLSELSKKPSGSKSFSTFSDILYFDPITEQFQAVEQIMSIGRSNHLSFALDEFPTAVCSPSTTPDYPGTTTQEFQTTATQESEDTTTPVFDTTTAATTSSATGLPPQCFVAGECEGDLIGILAGTVGADDCLAACRNTSGCVWFTEYEVKLIAFSPTHLIYIKTNLLPLYLLVAA